MIKCKQDERLFYIGQAVDLSVRLGSPFSRSALDTTKLGTFLNLIGWNPFSVHILDIFSEEELRVKEDKFIMEYLPTLNGKFASSYSNKIYRTLRTILKHMQFINRSKDKSLFQGNSLNYKLWIYDSTTLKWINNKPFDNLRLAQEKFVINVRTLNNYADTYTPYKGLYFCYKEIKDNSNLFSKSNSFNISNYIPKKYGFILLIRYT